MYRLLAPRIRAFSTTPIRRVKEYLPNEEWIERTNSSTKFGVTKSAIEQMGEIVYVEFSAEPSQELKEGEDLVVIESVKSVQVLTAPFNCILSENNHDLESDLDPINTDAESENSWLVKLN